MLQSFQVAVQLQSSLVSDARRDDRVSVLQRFQKIVLDDVSGSQHFFAKKLQRLDLLGVIKPFGEFFRFRKIFRLRQVVPLAKL